MQRNNNLAMTEIDTDMMNEICGNFSDSDVSADSYIEDLKINELSASIEKAMLSNSFKYRTTFKSTAYEVCDMDDIEVSIADCDHVHEVLDGPVKPYFDFDPVIKCEKGVMPSNDVINEMRERLYDGVKRFIGTNTCNILAFDASGWSDIHEEKYKVSMHFIINGMGFYESPMHFKQRIPKFIKELPGYDDQVYDMTSAGRNFRFPYTVNETNPGDGKYMDRELILMNFDERSGMVDVKKPSFSYRQVSRIHEFKDFAITYIKHEKFKKVILYSEIQAAAVEQLAKTTHQDKANIEGMHAEKLIDLLNCCPNTPEKGIQNARDWSYKILMPYINTYLSLENIDEMRLCEEALYKWIEQFADGAAQGSRHIVESIKQYYVDHCQDVKRLRMVGSLALFVKESYPEAYKEWSRKHPRHAGYDVNDSLYYYSDFKAEIIEVANGKRVFDSMTELITFIKKRIGRVLAHIMVGEGYYVKKMSIENPHDITDKIFTKWRPKFTYVKNESDAAYEKRIEADKEAPTATITLPTLLCEYSIIPDFSGMTTLPDENQNNYFSMWAGFKYEGLKNDEAVNEQVVKPFLDFMKHVICNNSVKKYDYFMDWLANIFQNPGQKQTCMILQGREGTGKGTLNTILKHLIGRKLCGEFSGLGEFCGRFNGLLADKKLIIANELKSFDSNGNSADMDKLKNLITDAYFSTEEKYQARRQLKSIFCFIFNTNHNAPIKITATDRRFNVFKLNNSRAMDNEYFAGLREVCLNDEFGDHMMQWLMSHKIESDVRAVIKTPERTLVINATQPVHIDFLSDAFEGDDTEFADGILLRDIFRKYKAYCENEGIPNKYIKTQKRFKLDALKQYLAAPVKRKKSEYYDIKTFKLTGY